MTDRGDESSVLSGLSKAVGESVVAIEGPLTSDRLDAAERLTRMRDDSLVVHEIIKVWRDQSDSERGLRKRYANVMLVECHWIKLDFT